MATTEKKAVRRGCAVFGCWALTRGCCGGTCSKERIEAQRGSGRAHARSLRSGRPSRLWRPLRGVLRTALTAASAAAGWQL